MEELLVMQCSDVILPVDSTIRSETTLPPEIVAKRCPSRSHTKSDNWELVVFDIFLKGAF